MLGSLAGEATLVPLDAPPPAFAAQAPLLSLPGAFGTSSDDIPAETPYLAADSGQAAAWAARLAKLPGLKVGLVWAGGPPPSEGVGALDRRRALAQAMMDRSEAWMATLEARCDGKTTGLELVESRGDEIDIAAGVFVHGDRRMRAPARNERSAFALGVDGP